MFKKWKLFSMMIFLGVAFVISGCTVVARDTRPVHKRKVVVKNPSGVIVYVKKAPPKAIAETPSAKPNTSAIWVSGFWKWNGKKYVWVNGYWDTNPLGKEWVSGKWQKTRNGWLREPGYWR
ncbi:MAG: hypothetical protein AAB116_12375 [Candidatus Poribacteria bacterium]